MELEVLDEPRCEEYRCYCITGQCAQGGRTFLTDQTRAALLSVSLCLHVSVCGCSVAQFLYSIEGKFNQKDLNRA